MKKIIAIAVIIIIALAISGCQYIRTSPSDTGAGYAEIIMPDGNNVSGRYDRAIRVSNGWIKVRMNGKWYAMNEWRVVLIDEVES